MVHENRCTLINPRRACAARVTVVGFSVCPLVANSLQERLFVFKPLSHTLRATKVKTFVGFSLKPLRCRDTALARCTATRAVGHLLRGKRACAYLTTPVRSSLRRREQQYKAVYENLCTQVKVINTTPSYKAKLDCLTTALCKNADFLRNELFLAMHDQRFIWHIS